MNKAIFALLATTTEAALNHKFSSARNAIHNARENNWSRPSLDNAWSAIDSAWDKIDNYGSNRGSSIDDRWAAYDRKGSSIDDKWAAIDNKWAAYDKKGSSIDDKWAAIDNKWSVMDHIHNAR